MSTPSDSFRIYGTHALEQKPVRLTAGRLTADLSDGNLRSIAYDGVEVLRAVSYLVRDRDWGTYAPEIADLTIEQGDDAFSVRYTARCKGPDATELSIGVRISAQAGAPLVFEADAISGTGFETNRCGFCILHPIVGVAGTPVTVEHADGQRVETRFPDQIEPWQPFMNMSAITHTVMTNVTARCGMECAQLTKEATCSRWKTSATGRMPPTRPMCVRSLCPGPTKYLSVKRSNSASSSILPTSALSHWPRRQMGIRR